MKFSLTIEGTESDIAQVMHALTLDGRRDDDTPAERAAEAADAIEPVASMTMTATERKAAKAKAKRAANAAAKKEKAEEDDLLSDGVNDEVTLEDVKAAAAAAIDDRDELDGVKAVFKKFKVAKLSKIKPADYEAVRDAIEAL